MFKKILIVDDNEMNRVLLGNTLCKDYDILEASDGKAALDIVRRAYQSLSAILLDIVMPEIDGYEVLRRIRDNVAYQNIPVIMVTGSEDEESRTKALALGANDFILKPYNPEIIRHCLKNNIAQYETAVKLNAMQKDKITGLFNREAFFERMAEMITAREPGHYLLSCFDIDNFKLINAQFGTVEGDHILREIGKVVTDNMGAIGCVGGRISADNFAILMPAEYADDSITHAHRGKRFAVSAKQTVVFSVGRYLITDTSLSPSAIYDRAYIAKQSVKGRYDEHIAYFDESMLEKLVRNQQIVADVDAAVAGRQFEVWYQPQRNHVTGALVGAEALVRWRHPQRGLISPFEFIPLFEQNGFIYELDKYVWEEVCACLRRWIDEGKNPVPVSVNVSRQDVFRPGFVGVLTGLLEKYRLPVQLLRVEITESAFAESTALIVEVVKQLIDLGFIVEIDDFGSGYSSLNTLKSVPAQVVKLDMRFLEDDNDGERGGNILSSVVRMAKWLGMSVIAEGVEEKAQADYLVSIGCSSIQGYYYSKPIPAEEYERYCENLGKERLLPTFNTVENLDNNALWDPKSMDTLVFSNYVGGACIFEYYKGELELLRSNRKFAAILGDGSLSVEDTLKLDWISCLAPESRELVREVLKRSCQTKEEYTNEYLFYNIPGAPEKTYLRGTMRVIAAFGERWLVYCTAENITAQREAEENEKRAIMHKELASGQMQAILDNVDVGIVASAFRDGVTRFLFANGKYYEILGYTKEQFEAEIHDPYETFAPQDVQRVKDYFFECVSREEPGVIEAYMLRRDGSERLVRDAFSTSHFVGIDEAVQLSIFRDITDEREAELKEKRSAEQIAAIMRGIRSGIMAATLNDKGEIEPLFTNDMYYALLGYTREQYNAEVKDIFSPIHPSDRERVYNKSREAYAAERPVQIEYRVICRDGSTRWLRVDLSSTRFSGVEQNVHLCVFNDMTEEREAERKLIETDEELQFLVSMANELLAQSDTELGINAALSKLADYFKGNRAYIFEIDTEKRLTSNTYEVCGDGVSAEIVNLQNLPLYLLDHWIDAFDKDGFYAIADVASLDGSRNDEKVTLLAQGISSLFVVPLRRDGKLIGMMGVDDPRRAVAHYDCLIAFGDYIAVMLTRRDLERRISKDHKDLSTLMDDMPGGFIRMRLSSDGEWIPFYFNEGFSHLTGMNREELREMFAENILNGIHPEDCAIVNDALRQMLKAGRAFSSRYRICHKTDSYIWVTTFGRLTTGLSGETILNAYYLDATGQVQEEELQKSLMDNMPCGAGIYEFKDGQMSLTYQNKIYWELVGLNEEAYPDASEMSAIHPDDIPTVMRELSLAIEQQRDVRCDIRLRHLTLGYRSVNLLGRVVFKETGGFLIYATFTPIPDVVIEARQQQARLALLTNSIPGGIAAYEGKADELNAIKLIYFSDGFCRLFGYSREEYDKLAKVNPLGLVTSDDMANMYGKIAALVRDGIPMDYIYRVKVKSGETKWINVKAVMGEPNGDKLTVNAVFLAMESGEAERLAEARAHSEKLSIALHAAEKADQAKSQFLSFMSHEIRTPLNAVIGYNNIARTEMTEAKTDEARRQANMKVMDCLTKSDVASRHLLTIINNVLDMSAIESGKLKVDDSPFDFRGLISSLTVLFFSQAKAKGVDFEVRLVKPTEEWFVGDQLRINQVLTNLLSNAVKFTPEGGSVTLAITESYIDQRSTGFCFTVSDTGIGMTQEYLEHIWTPFEQAEATISRRFGGSGLGLSITKNLVDLMNGSIKVKSQLGVGSTFTVDLTLLRTDQPQTAAEVDFSTVNALVVDDDSNTCDYIKLLFDRCNAKCLTLTSGQAAVKAFSAAQRQGKPFNLLLVDWHMPQMDGFATISAIRDIATTDLPIVVVTAYDFNEAAEHAANLGISRFITKPLFQSSLFDLLATVCGKQPAKAQQNASRYDFGGAPVLLVEDNNMNMEVAKHVLASANFTVDCAWNGQEAFDIFAASNPGTYKAVLMDVHMPNVDGYQATRMIRAANRPDAKTVPIVAMTADVFAEDIEQAHSAGMNDHIAKPINIEALLRLLATYIKGYKESVSE